MERVIEILVDTEGKASVKTQGFVGSACRDASKLIEKALGQVTSDKSTPEFYQAQQQVQQQSIGRRS